MTRRYGRNQRRAHRAEIARLKAQITGSFAIADGTSPVLPGHIIRQSVTDSEGVSDYTRKMASVELAIDRAPDLDALMGFSGVEWRGLKWKVVAPPRLTIRSGLTVAQVELESFAERRAAGRVGR